MARLILVGAVMDSGVGDVPVGTYVDDSETALVARIRSAGGVLMPEGLNPTLDALVARYAYKSYSSRSRRRATQDHFRDSLAAILAGEEGIRREVWAKQANWYWHPTTGDDRADGASQITPVKTWGEIARRMGTAPLQQLTDVWLMGDSSEVLTAPQTLQLKDGAGGVSYMLRIRGDLGITTKVDSTFTGSTALNAATNTPTDVTDAGINWNTAFDGGSALGHRLRRKSDNAIGWIQKIISATQARTTAWATLDPFAANPSITPTLQSNPGLNAYVLERLPKIGGVNLSVLRKGRTHASNFVAVLFDSLWYDDSVGTPGCQVRGSAMGAPYFSRCKFGLGPNTSLRVGISDYFSYLINCHFHSPSIQFSGSGGFFLTGGGAIGAIAASSSPETAISISKHFMLQGGVLFLRRTNVTGDGLCVFDSTAAGVSVLTGGRLDLGSSGVSLWGSGNATFGADVPSGSVILTGSTVPTITGATNEVRVAGDAGGTWAAKIAAGFLTNKLAGVVQA